MSMPGTPHSTPSPEPEFPAGAQPPYGTGQQAPYAQGPQGAYTAGGSAPRPGNGLAVAGFVVALLGLPGSFIPVINLVSIVLGVIGAILAAVGLARSRRTGTGKGLALAGLIIGVLTVVIAVAINIAAANAVDDALDDAFGSSVAPPKSADKGSDGKDSASKVGTTRTNPAPIGSAINNGDWTVTINSVKTIDADKYGSKAADGSVLLQVNITATYTGDDEQGETPWSRVRFVTAEGTTISSTDGSTLFIAEKPFDSLATIYKDASVTGDEILEVPAETWKDGVLAVAPTAFADDVFVAVK